MLFVRGLIRSAISQSYTVENLRNLTTKAFKNVSHNNIVPFLSHPALTNADTSWIWQQNDKIKLPVANRIQIELPHSYTWRMPQIDPDENKLPLEEPNTGSVDIKEAVTMIIVRRKKMKKHKLKKLRKRMKYEWAKLRQRRELRKEKAFQAELIQQCKDGEAFSAEKYVQERIDKLNEIIIPRTWKGKRLPEFIIREKMGLPPKS